MTKQQAAVIDSHTGGRRRRLPTSRHANLAAARVAFLSPALILVLVFTLIPIGLTFWISLHRWSMLTPMSQMEWAGFSNYTAVWNDATHREALANTFTYVGLSLLITLPLALLIAMLLFFPPLRGKSMVRVALFATYVIPTVAIVIIWSNLYAPGYGPFDTILSWFSIKSPGWLSHPRSALISLVIFNVWQMLGYYVVLLIAGLTSIPDDVYEAARLDGAGPIRQTFAITIPLLRNSLFFVAMMTIINSVQVFDPIYMLTQGGPINSTNVISFDIQRTAFQNGLAGQASAMAFSLFALIAILAGTFGLFTRRRR